MAASEAAAVRATWLNQPDCCEQNGTFRRAPLVGIPAGSKGPGFKFIAL